MSAQVRDPVIDADGHVLEIPQIWDQYLEARYRGRGPRLVFDEHGHPAQVVDDRVLMRHAMLLTLGPDYSFESVRHTEGGWDPNARLRDMDSEGIDVAVLFPSVSFYFAEVPDPELQAALCRAYNNWLADFCHTDPTRLVGVALLPLVDVDASVQELERAVKALGFRAAFFRPNPYGGRPIQHPAYERFWACAASLGVPVTVHEGLSDTLPTLGRERFENPAILHVLSHPFEQMAACAGLILTGVLDRHPNLRVAFLESGSGWLPYWLERMDSHIDTWGKLLPAVKRRPSEAFREQCVISTEPGEDVVEAVVRHVGDECVIWASDYPHPDAHFPGAVTKTLESLAPLSPESRRRILAENAARLYGIEVPRRA